MKKFIYILIIFVFSFSNIEVFASENTVVDFQIKGEVKKNSNIDILVNIDSVENLYAASIKFNYDSKKLKITKIEEGSNLKEHEDQIMEVNKKVDKENNTATYEFTFLGENEGISGDINLVKITCLVLSEDGIDILANNLNAKLIKKTKDKVDYDKFSLKEYINKTTNKASESETNTNLNNKTSESETNNGSNNKTNDSQGNNSSNNSINKNEDNSNSSNEVTISKNETKNSSTNKITKDENKTNDSSNDKISDSENKSNNEEKKNQTNNDSSSETTKGEEELNSTKTQDDNKKINNKDDSKEKKDNLVSPMIKWISILIVLLVFPIYYLVKKNKK